MTMSPAYDHFLEFVLERATVEDILAFQLPAAEQARAIKLLDKQDRDELTQEEIDELEQMAQINRVVSALKAKALASQNKS